MFEVSDILKFNSVSIVGMAKNTGKTECLNYLLGKIGDEASRFALTSIGIDGEKRDQVCQTAKPEIVVPAGMLFVTSEKHYREKRLIAEILDISREQTALGRLVTARAISPGKVLLSGPSDTFGLKMLIERMKRQGLTTLVDGALSRLSLASPAVTDAMILATGAAVSGNIPELVRRTRFVYDLISLREVEHVRKESLECLSGGVWAVDDEGGLRDLQLASAFMFGQGGEDLLRYGNCLFVAGAVTDKLLKHLRLQKQKVELIVWDFTRVFATPETYYAFVRNGGQIRVLHSCRLLAVTVNPVAPSGLVLDSMRLCEAMEAALGLPVYDIKKTI